MMMNASILPHNQRPAAVWSSGGQAYDEISSQIASALDHCVRRLRPRPGELRGAFVAFHDRFATPLGIGMPRQYLVTLGTRR
jgi:hypothetical protein